MAEADPNNPGYDTDGEPLVKGVISAVGAAVGHGATGTKSPLAVRMQEAMTNAVVQAQADGITDEVEFRTRVHAARDAVLAEGSA